MKHMLRAYLSMGLVLCASVFVRAQEGDSLSVKNNQLIRVIIRLVKEKEPEWLWIGLISLA